MTVVKKSNNLIFTPEIKLDCFLRMVDFSENNICFICDENSLLLGSVVKQDVLDYIQCEGTLDSSIINIANKEPICFLSTQIEEAESYLSKSVEKFVPLVDSNKKMIDILAREESVEYEILPLEKKHLDIIVEFIKQMDEETKLVAYASHDLSKILLDCILAIENKNELILGMFRKDNHKCLLGIVYLWSLHKSVPWLGIIIREHMQGNGLGKTLISYTEAYLQMKKYAGIMLSTSLGNSRAQSFFRAVGFDFLGTSKYGEMLFFKSFSHFLE